MRFKSLLLSASVLTAIALFTYCTKETPVSAPTPVANTDEQETNDRGVCKVTIQANNWNIDVCGVQNSLVQCGVSSTGQNLFGTATIMAGNNIQVALTTPTSLIITRNTVGPVANVTADVTTANGTFNYFVPAFGSVQVDIDNNCNQ